MKYISVFFLLSGMIVWSGCRNEAAAVAARKSLRDSQTPFTESAFTAAIAEGDTEKVSLFLTGGIETGIGQHNSNALIVAAENNKPDIVKKLLDHGVEIDPKGFSGSPLCVAANKNYPELVQLLISRGADVDYLQGSINPLILSSAAGHEKVVEALIKAGADINIQGESTKYSPLILAARNGHTNVVQLLLAKKADTRLEDHGGKTALEYAIFKGQTDAAKLLINDPGFDPDNDSTPALVMAISMDKTDIIREIIKKGTNLNAEYGSMPLLSWAIFNNYTKGAELLIDAGADIEKADKLQMIPIDYALAAKNDKIVQLLRSAAKAKTSDK